MVKNYPTLKNLVPLFFLLFSIVAFSQIEQRGAATTATNGGTSLTINKPTGIAIGDIMIANISESDNNALSGNVSITGWSIIDGRTLGANNMRGTVLYKIAVASDLLATNYTFTLSTGTDSSSGAIIAFSGVDTSNPFDVTPGIILVRNDNSLRATEITTVTANAAIIMLGQVGNNRTFSNWTTTSPGGLTELYDINTTIGEDSSVGGAWVIKPTIGTTGIGYTTLNSSARNGGILLALRPATITTGVISPTYYCAGTNVTVPYTKTGTYNAGNIFTAQLSNASGSFASPVNIGSLTSTANGIISGTIPVGTAAGTGYRIRVVSSNPVIIGTNNGSNLTVNAAPNAPLIGTITQPSCTTATGSVVLNGLPATGTWALTRNPGAVTTSGTGASTTIAGLSPGTYTYTVIESNNGTGLNADYFNNRTLSGTPALTRTDATVNFDWGNGNPGAPIGNDNFSVRWSGQIQPLYTENYTFTTRSDDGVRLWVNGTLIINQWNDYAVTNHSGTITLSAGVKYDIVLEYYENAGQAVAQLSWSSASQANQIIPQSQLFPSAGCTSIASANVVINAQTASPTITPNNVDETCPASNNGSISPVISGGLTSVRYIKLTQKHADWQQVAEIQAFEIFTGTNVALTSNGASASSSSIYSNDATTFGPQKAIDGDFTGYSFWHSNSTNINEYIIVDLASGKNIDYLRIHNRVDCCQVRGQNMLLELYDATNNLVYSKTIDLWEGVNGSHYVDINVLDVSWADGATTLTRAGLDSGTYTLNYTDAAGCSLSSQIDISSITTNNTWNGSVSTDWNTAGNWSCGVPSITNDKDVLIPSGLLPTYPYPKLSTFLDPTYPEGYAKNIVFESGTTLIIENNTLNITGILTLNGKIDLNNEAQLMQDTGSTFDAASTGNIEIDQQGTSDNYRFNYWGSPVNNTGTAFTISGVLRDGTDPATINEFKIIDFGTPYAYADGVAPLVGEAIKLSTYWMYKYANLGIGYNGWTRAGKDGNLYAGEGFTLKGSNTNLTEQNYTFVGKPNNGDINLTISANNDYLIGNPYPSALDAREFIRDNISAPSGSRTVDVIDGNLYFWDHFGGGSHLLKSYEGGYGIVNLTGETKAMATDALINNTGNTSTKIPPKFIPVAQGFFVTAVSGIVGTENIQFKNSQRLYKKENPLVSQFMKSAKFSKSNKETEGEDTFPKIYLKYSSPKGFHRQILVGFIENTTDGIDIGYDAVNYETFAEDMSWRTNNINFIIQAVSSLNDERVLPLEVKVAVTGIIKISIDNAENIPDDTEIFVKDSNTGVMHNISQKPFEINLEPGKYVDRFALTFKTQKLVAEDVVAELLIPAATQPIIEGIHVFMNNAIGELQIKNNSTEEIVSVALLNSLGQTVKIWNSNFNIRTISLPLSTAAGVYLVQINTKTGKTVKKISVE